VEGKKHADDGGGSSGPGLWLSHGVGGRTCERATRLRCTDERREEDQGLTKTKRRFASTKPVLMYRYTSPWREEKSDVPSIILPQPHLAFVKNLLRDMSSEAPAAVAAVAAAAPAAAGALGAAKTPADFLKSIRGKQVVVKLNSGVDYRGILACLDGYMNIGMEQTEVRGACYGWSRALRRRLRRECVV